MALWLLWTALAHGQVSGPNLALHKPVDASGALWGSFLTASLTDGDTGSFAHPATDTGTLGFYFEIDLGATFQLERILVRNRGDGCCTERLSNYAVEIYSDNGGESGVRTWRGIIRADGSNSGVGGVDVVTRTNSVGGTFGGRFIRIVNVNGAAYAPQVAEVEVYGAATPEIRFFEAERDALPSGQSTVLRWEISGATGAAIQPGVGSVNATNGFVTISPGTTTTYTLTATNAGGPVSATVNVGVDVALLPPRINEFMADNENGLRDEDGDHSDWIEIYNPNDYGVDLGDFFLTDNPANLLQWRFPNVRLPRRGFLVVFASQKSRRAVPGELHTNFKLDTNGEYLALVDSSRQILQQFPASYPSPATFPAQTKDASYGLGTNSTLGFFRATTPGASNGFAFTGIVGDLRFGRERGFYDTNFALTIQCPTPGVTIRFTTNFATPTATAGTVYSSPIAVTRTMVVRAAAFRQGWAPTDPVTHSYVFLSNVIAAANMNKTITQNAGYAPVIRAGLLDLPTISITTPNTINGGAEVKTAIEWLNPNGAAGFQVDCGIRYFGGAFTDFAKKNFRLYFRDEWGVSKLGYPVFAGFDRGIAAVDEFDQLELRGGSHDMSQRGFYMSNVFTDDTLLEMGHLNPHGRFVHVYLNGVYWGMYHLRERWGAAMHQEYLGGAKTDYESINGNWNVGGWADPGSPYDGDGSVWERIKGLRSDYIAVKSWLDVPEYVDYMLMWMFGGAETEYRAVGPNVPGSGFKFYLNDADGWFCGPYYCAAGNNTVRGAPGRDAGDGPGSIFSMLARQGHPDYRALLGDHIQKHFFNGGALTSARNRARLLARCQEVERAFIAESARWNQLTPAEWASRRDHALNVWLPARTSEAFNQYKTAGFYPSVPAPTLNQQGGVVQSGFEARFPSPAASIYYTTNGADPRLPGGTVSPSAQLYSSGSRVPVILTNTALKARAKTGSTWSALNEAFFQTSPSLTITSNELVVSELNFLPANRDGSEFLELHNISDAAINLRGARFSLGIAFQFATNRDEILAPGHRLVLVKDLFRFQRHYGLDVNVAGIYGGGLSSTGEQLAFLDTASNPIFFFRYQLAPPWPVTADAAGYSIILSRRGFAWNDPRAWHASPTASGTPGWADETIFTGDATADIDQDGLPALLEYAVGSLDTDPTSRIDISPAFINNGDYLAFTFTRSLRADDVGVTAEFSSDLSHWTPGSLLATVQLPNALAAETWGVFCADKPVLFMRLRATRE
ncbi:MAG TPA: lamin tail domain-containing protein [Verrucomicrobiae bacterium]|nr:lamin tail domain-containing protein [Verrucomicrobiae bacterium]